MAIPRRFKVGHDEVFPFGAYQVGDVQQVFVYNAKDREARVPQLDPDTGLLTWSVDVVDADPEAKKKAKTVSVKILAAVQPVPPEPIPGLPFRLVAFEDLEATPYLEETGSGDQKRTRLAWSFRARGITAPKSAAPLKAAS